jgi:hypothetical protein
VTPAKNLPPSAASNSLKTLWQAAIPGQGCSSPIVCQGRVYVTTAYEGTEPHPCDRPAFWTIAVLACSVAGLTLAQLSAMLRSLKPRPVVKIVLGLWTISALVLSSLVLAKPTWFWNFADAWSGTMIAKAERRSCFSVDRWH